MKNNLSVPENMLPLVKKFIGTLETESRNKEFLFKLSYIAAEISEFGLAHEIREFEKANFTDEEKPFIQLMDDSHNIHNIMRLLGVNADEATCHKFMRVIGVYKEKGLNFDIMDSANIKKENKDLYGS